MQVIILVVFIGILSFTAGKLVANKKEVNYEIDKFSRGANAGDAAVKSYRMRKQKK